MAQQKSNPYYDPFNPDAQPIDPAHPETAFGEKCYLYATLSPRVKLKLSFIGTHLVKQIEAKIKKADAASGVLIFGQLSSLISKDLDVDYANGLYSMNNGGLVQLSQSLKGLNKVLRADIRDLIGDALRSDYQNFKKVKDATPQEKKNMENESALWLSIYRNCFKN